MIFIKRTASLAVFMSASAALASQGTVFVEAMFGNLGMVQPPNCTHRTLASVEMQQASEVQCARTRLGFDDFQERWDLYAGWSDKVSTVPTPLTPWRELVAGSEWERIYRLADRRLIVTFTSVGQGSEVTTNYGRTIVTSDAVPEIQQDMPDPPNFAGDMQTATRKFLTAAGYTPIPCQNGVPQAYGRLWTICFRPPDTYMAFKTQWPRIKPILSEFGRTNAYFNWMSDAKGGGGLVLATGDNHFVYANYIQQNRKLPHAFIVISLVSRN